MRLRAAIMSDEVRSEVGRLLTDRLPYLDGLPPPLPFAEYDEIERTIDQADATLSAQEHAAEAEHVQFGLSRTEQRELVRSLRELFDAYTGVYCRALAVKMMLAGESPWHTPNEPARVVAALLVLTGKARFDLSIIDDEIKRRRARREDML